MEPNIQTKINIIIQVFILNPLIKPIIVATIPINAPMVTASFSSSNFFVFLFLLG